MKFYSQFNRVLFFVLLSCVGCLNDSRFHLGGAVSGLNGTVILQNQGTDDLTLTADGEFVFPTKLYPFTEYNVSVLTQPTSQTCTVTQASGTLIGSSVTDVSVTCTINSYEITVSGDDNVSISPNTTQTVDYGATPSFVVTANPGYILSETVEGTCPLGSWTDTTYTTGAITSSCSVSFSATNPNAPWYPSVSAFEHYDSGRSHLFSEATFAGDFSGDNTVTTSASNSFPSLYNMVYLDADHIFAYGGGHGDQSESIGAYVTHVGPESVEPVWFTQLVDTSSNGEWDYPGGLGLLDNGFLYVVYGYRLSQIDLDTGDIIATLELPTGEALPENTAYDGLNATADGVLVMKTLYRQAGCGLQGASALVDCPDPTDVPASILISVDPETLTVLDEVTLSDTPSGRLTVSRYENENYVYLSTASSWLRYTVDPAGELGLDATWDPGNVLEVGQTATGTLVVMGDWVIGQTNTTPAETELSVIAVDQGDAQNQFSVKPFLGSSIPALVSTAFAHSAPGGVQANSWSPASVSADVDTHFIYVTDALPGRLAGLSFDAQSGFALIWLATHVTTEAVTIIGSETERLVVGADIPEPQIPGQSTDSFVVWREASTGAEVCRSESLPTMTSGSLIQPYYNGKMFYSGGERDLYLVTPTAVH